MSTSSTGLVRFAGFFLTAIGAIFLISGIGTWFMASNQLKAEKIVVADDADSNAGAEVAGPFTAMSQANVVAKHVEAATGGKTMVELKAEQRAAQEAGDTEKAEELEQLATMAETGSFTRASLITSVIAFGVAALVAGLGVVQIVTGLAFTRLARKNS